MTPSTTGPSTTQTPYLIPTDPRVRFVSLLSAGDRSWARPTRSAAPGASPASRTASAPSTMATATLTVLVNHELQPRTAGRAHDNGAPRRLRRQAADRQDSLAVVGGRRTGQAPVHSGTPTTDAYVENAAALSRLCSADLPAPSAFYDATTGLGTKTRILLNGEESGPEGRAFAWIAMGRTPGKPTNCRPRQHVVGERARLAGQPAPAPSRSATKTVTRRPTLLYAGDKQASGSDIERAGLTDGVLYGIKADFLDEAASGQVLSGNFTLASLGDYTNNVRRRSAGRQRRRRRHRLAAARGRRLGHQRSQPLLLRDHGRDRHAVPALGARLQGCHASRTGRHLHRTARRHRRPEDARQHHRLG